MFGNSSFISYAVIYCSEVATVYGGAYIYFKDDVIIATSIAQLCMHYLYLGETLSKLDARQEEESNKKLGKLIRFQYRLDSICNDINEIYSYGNFFAFTCVRIYACLFLFALINSNDLVKTPTFALQLFLLFLSVYFRCSLGMNLFEASSKLLFSIYDQNWYEGTPKYRKTILIMMIKANRPMQLQASKLKTVSMEYFKEIIVSTYEIFMFLYNFTK
ncbi:odorant receptor 88a-like [Episyrphus balteatus]|uniref:odorant receptor 88a-like n=1 Tax=Episyrphus balteatus TaxID=286459 RepID=UPI002485AE3D|nr:odorant receptor 88a-like [Episyrphus balteatus]